MGGAWCSMARIRLLGMLPGMSGLDVERGLVSLFRTDPIRPALCHPLMANHARSPRLSRVNAHWATGRHCRPFHRPDKASRWWYGQGRLSLRISANIRRRVDRHRLKRFMTSGPMSASRCPSSQAPSQHAMALDRAELRLSASPTRKPTVALARVPELSRAHVALGEAACRTAAAQSITTPPVSTSRR